MFQCLPKDRLFSFQRIKRADISGSAFLPDFFGRLLERDLKSLKVGRSMSLYVDRCTVPLDHTYDARSQNHNFDFYVSLGRWN